MQRTPQYTGDAFAVLQRDEAWTPRSPRIGG